MTRRVWPARLALREGVRGALARPLASTIIVGATAWLLGAIAIADAAEVDRLADAEAAWIAAGGYGFVVEPGVGGEGEGLSVVACERLNSVTGIRSAYAVAAVGKAASPVTAPGTTNSVVSVSPGVFHALHLSAPATATVLVTAETTKLTALQGEEATQLVIAPFGDRPTGDPVAVTVVAIDSNAVPSTLVGGYVAPDLVAGSADQCIVTTDAAHVSAVAEVLGTMLATGPSTPAITRPRLSANTFGVDFSTAYASRALRWAWVAAAIALSTLWAIVHISRRSRMAIYATFGAGAIARLLIQVSEWLVLSGAGAIWGWASALAFAYGVGIDPHIAFVEVTGQVLAAWCAAGLFACGLGIVPIPSLLDALKDRS